MSDGHGIEPAVPPSGPGCVECTQDDGWWFHLRRCAHLRARRVLRLLTVPARDRGTTAQTGHD